MTILTLGSRGDVQPYVALGAGLQQAGHDVVAVAHERFEALFGEVGLERRELRSDPQSTLREAAARSWLASGRNPVRFMRGLEAAVRPSLHVVLADFLAACLDRDLVLFPALAALPAASIAQKLEIGCLPAYLQHVHPCAEYPLPPIPPVRLPGLIRGAYNRLSYPMASSLFWTAVGRTVNAWRQEQLGLPPFPHGGGLTHWFRQRRPCLYGFSHHVVPKAAGWGSEVHLTGYWHLPAGPAWQPPARLKRFLAAGPPPVYVGFGSMPESDPCSVSEMVLNALLGVGARVVLSRGWAGFSGDDLPDGVIAVDETPHDWLFPKMAVIVHHGGAGTTAAALRAGVPSIVVPLFADQYFWAWRVQALGAGPPPIPRRRLTATRLAAALREVTEATHYRDRAAALGRLLRGEDGVRRAVELVGRYGSCREES